jgi:enamine deaminase RidA (YjgF/YER057c/UK114 family)
MGIIEKRLEELGLSLPVPKPPVGNYLGSKRMGEVLYASARVSDCIGEVGVDVTLEKAKEAARNTVLMILAIVKQDIKDLNLITGVLKMTGFVRSSVNFIEQPKVIDGASDLLIELFQENGRHARTATGVAQMPSGACVQLDIIFQMQHGS